MGVWFPQAWTKPTRLRRVQALRIEADVIIHILKLLENVTLVWPERPGWKEHIRIEGLPSDVTVVGVRVGEGLHQVEILLESEEFEQVESVLRLDALQLRVATMTERPP